MEKELMFLVKKKAQERSLTQKQVAKEMRVSLPTVKRWWSGKGVTLQVLERICMLLEMPLSELFLESENRAHSRYSYTVEQENMLVQHPQALALFDLLVSGKSLGAIKRKYQLPEALVSALLLKLGRVKLVRVLANNKAVLMQQGEPQWIPGGPLSQKYRKTMIASLLGEHAKEETTFLIHDYLPEDAALIQTRIKELEKLMNLCNAKSGSSGSAASYGVYVKFKKFEWDLRASLNQKPA
jgi:transcriptional regulator with XRE-family HTH domain